MKFTDVMIDLETMGCGNDAAIMSIGAVVFHPETGTIGSTYHAKLDLKSCLALGLKVDAETIMWWLEQSKEAQASLIEGQPMLDPDTGDMIMQDGAPIYARENIREALTEFGFWIDALKQSGELELLRVWGNGPTFDITILENAMKPFEPFFKHILPPWHFRQHRDVRTLRDVAIMAGSEDFKETLDFEGVPHNALDDAKFQAQYVSKFWQFLS